MSIQVKGIHKQFGDFVALNNVDLNFNSGELVALLGPSGCGKTTLLRIIAGLEQADSGQVLLDGEDSSNTHVRDRNVGFVFQHYALFKHMTVFDNVAFGMRMKPRALRPSKDQIAEKVHNLLKLVQLDWLADRFPAQLSGGQRQRIALARALAVEPKVLLLDEPFGALDAKVRKELRRWLRRLHDELHITSIFVTHDQEEALEVADRVVVMNQGQVEQIGTPEAVYHHPATPFVYGFLGAVNLFQGRHQHEGIQVGEANLVHAQTVFKGQPSVSEGAEVLAFARPHEIEIHADEEGPTGLPAKVARVMRFGLNARVELDSLELEPAQHFDVELSAAQALSLNLHEGQRVRISAKALQVFEHKKQENFCVPPK
jgi:sulfate transport system ATP-binding protein